LLLNKEWNLNYHKFNVIWVEHSFFLFLNIQLCQNMDLMIRITCDHYLNVIMYLYFVSSHDQFFKLETKLWLHDYKYDYLTSSHVDLELTLFVGTFVKINISSCMCHQSTWVINSFRKIWTSCITSCDFQTFCPM